MLNIIGLILLWILRIIAFILGFIIFLILIILFVPFRYDAEASFDEKINVKVKFSWLFRIINGKFIMDDKGQNTSVRVLLFKVYPAKEKKDKASKDKASKDKATKDKKNKGKSKKTKDLKKNEENAITLMEKAETGDVSTVSKAEDVVEADAKKSENQAETSTSEVDKSKEDKLDTVNEGHKEEDKEELEVALENLDDKEEDKSTKSKKKSKKSKKDKKNKDKKNKEPNKNLEQAKEMWAFLQETENKGVLKFITKYIVKIIKWILPRKVFVDMELGLEDPALTGYIAAVTSIVYVATKKNIHIAPNFNEQVIKGDFRIKGRLYLYQLLYYIIRVIIDKRVRRLIKKVRS